MIKKNENAEQDLHDVADNAIEAAIRSEDPDTAAIGAAALYVRQMACIMVDMFYTQAEETATDIMSS